MLKGNKETSIRAFVVTVEVEDDLDKQIGSALADSVLWMEGVGNPEISPLGEIRVGEEIMVDVVKEEVMLDS